MLPSGPKGISKLSVPKKWVISMICEPATAVVVVKQNSFQASKRGKRGSKEGVRLHHFGASKEYFSLKSISRELMNAC